MTNFFRKLIIVSITIFLLSESFSSPVWAEKCCVAPNACVTKPQTCTDLGLSSCPNGPSDCPASGNPGSGGGGTTTGICNPVLPWLCGTSGGPQAALGNIISTLVALILIVSGFLAFGMLLIGGVQWITSGGDKAGLESARNRIIHAIIGLIIVASSWAIMLLVLNDILGICFPNINIPVIGQTSASKACAPRPGGGGSGTTPGSGGNPGGGGTNPGGGGTYIKACPCIDPTQCAQENAIGLRAGKCYQCTKSGWDVQTTTACAAIQCGSCP